MPGDTRKRLARIRPLRKRGQEKAAEVNAPLDRCEDMPPDWGPWFRDWGAGLLVCDIPGFPKGAQYEISLTRCQTSAQKCDWLAQIAEKSWATREVLGGLVQALDAVVGLRPEPGER